MLDVVKDSKCVMKVFFDGGGVHANGHELVEGVPVLLQTSAEYAGLDLLQLPHGFAAFEERNTCPLGEFRCNVFV